MKMGEIVQLIKNQGSTLANPIEIEGMPPMTFSCSVSNQPAAESEFSMLPFECPADLQGFWALVATARLFVDQEYGQWGLEILSPTQSVELTARFREERHLDSKLGDLVIGRFLGDSDLLIVRCDPASDDFGAVLVVLPLDPRIEWDLAAGSFALFLEYYIVSGGEKFWRDKNHVSKLFKKMSPIEFIEAIKTEVRDATSSDTMTQLHTPTGRRPAENLRRLSVWFNHLSEGDQQAVAEVVAMASHNAVFGLLCVLDGVRPIQEGHQAGELHLMFVESDKPSVRLNPATGDTLHDLINAI